MIPQRHVFAAPPLSMASLCPMISLSAKKKFDVVGRSNCCGHDVVLLRYHLVQVRALDAERHKAMEVAAKARAEAAELEEHR